MIFAEDVEHIFGKRPWASRSEEIIANKKSEEEGEKNKEKEQPKEEDEKTEPLVAETPSLSEATTTKAAEKDQKLDK